MQGAVAGAKQTSGVRASAESHQKILRLEGAADVNAELAEIGLSGKSGWYASTFLYGTGGLVALVVGLLRPDVVPAGVTLLGAFAILVSGLSALGAKYLANDDWATHVRLVLGLSIFLVGAFIAGDLRLAFTMLPLFVLITPTFLYGARFALPYVCVVTPALFIAVLLTPGAAQLAHAVITAGAMVMITSSFIAAEHRTRSLARENRRMAYTDPLTGIANTRRLRQKLSESLRSEEPFALFAIDLDNFKLVNDTFDHTTGDLVLKAVGEALVDQVSDEDLVARRGGDEFSVMISHPAGVELERIEQRLAKAIHRARLATCPQVTPSGSVAHVISEPGDSISSVLQRADDALHESKQAFRSMQQDAPLSDGVADDLPRLADREAAMRSVSAAVSRAYSRPAHGKLRLRVNFELRRAFEFVRTTDPIWGYAAATIAPIGIVFALLSVTGALSPLPWAVGLLCGMGMIALAGMCLRAARVRYSKRWLPWALLAAIGLVSLTIAFAGSAGVALLDTYVVLALFGFYVLPPRQSATLLGLCAVLFAGFSVVGDFPDPGIRSAVTISVMVVAAVIVVKVRSVTLGFVRTNRELSEVDALTGVANLRALRLRVETAIHKAEHEQRLSRPMLMTIDLDRFKQVNDVYNHTTGDQVLEAVARAISECVRIDEMVARRGGDEFFVLFSSSSPDHLRTVIPRVQDAVAHARERICPDLTPTASVGYVSWEQGWDVDQFLAAADLIMHDEKIDTRARGYSDTEAQLT